MKTYPYVLILALNLANCGSQEDSKKDPATEPAPPVPTATPAPTPALTPVPVPPIDLTSRIETDCKNRSDDFDWIEGKCVEKPNEILAGELELKEGIIWEPNSRNCTPDYDADNKPRPNFKRCEGADVTIPLARPAAGKGKNLLRLSYKCDTVVDIPFDIEVGDVSATISPKRDASDVFKIVSDVDADNPVSLKLKFIPKNYKGGFILSAVSYPKECKILLLDNRLVNSAQ
ncbi:MAG: hypothetical protein M3Q07_09090 [Pseudobdellovibrionaceae bacterium]|nr:hypothetical protein [Pseudobdellovibrionaceae bacterium]